MKNTKSKRQPELQKIKTALKDAQQAEGKFVVIRKYNHRYLSDSAGATGWATKLSSAKLFDTIGTAITTAKQLGGRSHSVAKIEAGGFLGATVWN